MKRTHAIAGLVFVALAALVVSACKLADGPAEAPAGEVGFTVAALDAAIANLEPLHEPLPPTRPGDWLAHNDEPGQTFAEYRPLGPPTADGERRVIYVHVLGEPTDVQREVIEITAEYIQRFFSLEVRMGQDLPLSLVPNDARRANPYHGMQQLDASYILNNVLYPNLPDDAAAYLALTAEDLWPGDDWNFVFGLGSPDGRVGVWSLYRNGDPAAGDDEFLLCLRRTVKTAVHETGHVLGLMHCTAWNCVMCGSNSLPESDRQPMWLCPQCVAKICWTTQADPVARYGNLAEFCGQVGLMKEQGFFLQAIDALRQDGD